MISLNLYLNNNNYYFPFNIKNQFSCNSFLTCIYLNHSVWTYTSAICGVCLGQWVSSFWHFVSEREQDVLDFYLSISCLETYLGLEPVPKSKPNTYQTTDNDLTTVPSRFKKTLPPFVYNI